MSDTAPEPAPTIPAQIEDLEQRLAALETRFPEAIAAEVGKVAGPVAAEAVRDALEPYVGKIEDLTDRFANAAERQGQNVDEWAHQKIDALTNAVKRAIGIDVPMPSKPGEIVTGDVTVLGAETADQLSKG